MRRRQEIIGTVGMFFLLGTVLVGCAGSGEDLEDPRIRIQGLSKDAFVIGEVFEAEGNHFEAEEGDELYLTFEGRFVREDGLSEDVSFDAPANFVGSDSEGQPVVRWARLGPFTNPFTESGQAGRFQGNIRPKLLTSDGGVREGDSSETFSFDVEPSIEITELQPIGADCGMAALSGVAGIPYRISVRAMGFAPDDFEYQVTGLEGTQDLMSPVVWSRTATGPEDSIGDESQDLIVFKPVPADKKFYVATIRVRATDRTTGKSVETVLPFGVHRPIEIDYDGNYEIAEHYEPEPVTACIPGSVGNRVTYSETNSQSRQSSVAVRIGQSWAQDHSTSMSQSWTEGYGVSMSSSQTAGSSETDSRSASASLGRNQNYRESESNSFDYSTTDGENWNVSNNVGVGVGATVGAKGKAGIPLVAEGEVSATASVEASYDRGWGEGGSRTEGRSWGSSAGRERSAGLSESYSLNSSSSRSRSFSDTSSRSDSKTYNFGAGATTGQRVSEGLTEDESNTWAHSESSSTLTAYTGFIPVGRFGVFYRQTIRLVRRARLYTYTACGEREPMGEIMMSEWKWAPDLAVDDTCDTKLPPSNLPPAKCHIQPCE